MSAAGIVSCPVEVQYRPPPGYFDYPYIYVIDYTNVVAGGADPRATTDIRVALQLDNDSDFLLRRVQRFALDSLDDFQLYAAGGNFMFSTPVRGDAESVYPMVPEVTYARGSRLQTDVNNWASATTLSFGGQGPFAYVAQTLFQGVKRFRGGESNPVESSYEYKGVPFCYTVTLVLDWTFIEFPYGTLQRAAPRLFAIQIQNQDFELQRISIIRTDTGAVMNNVDSPSFRLLLRDPTQRQMMSQHVYGAAINQSMTGNNRLFPAFPVPPLLYPRGSVLEYEIISHLDDPGGGGAPAAVVYNITFCGIRRRECYAG